MNYHNYLYDIFKQQVSSNINIREYKYTVCISVDDDIKLMYPTNHLYNAIDFQEDLINIIQKSDNTYNNKAEFINIYIWDNICNTPISDLNIIKGKMSIRQKLKRYFNV